MWVFVVHLILVFGATWGTAWSITYGHRAWGVTFGTLWFVVFLVTSMDQVRIPWFEWVGRVRKTGSNKEG
jgi:hypothetical protein